MLMYKYEDRMTELPWKAAAAAMTEERIDFDSLRCPKISTELDYFHPVIFRKFIGVVVIFFNICPQLGDVRSSGINHFLELLDTSLFGRPIWFRLIDFNVLFCISTLLASGKRESHYTSDMVHMIPTLDSDAARARSKTSVTPWSVVARPMRATAKTWSHSLM
jgi:hypothetical protein